VKCVSSGKWFCSHANHSSSNSSHIINHLVRSRNHTVQLHPDSPLGATILECYNCGGRNVFVLGFVPAKGDSVVVLLCRCCVETVPALKEMDWNIGQWCSLITDKKFVDWLVPSPPETAVIQAREITNDQVNKLEELWKKEPDATLEDLERPDTSQDTDLQVSCAIAGRERTREDQRKDSKRSALHRLKTRHELLKMRYSRSIHAARLLHRLLSSGPEVCVCGSCVWLTLVYIAHFDGVRGRIPLSECSGAVD